MQITIYKKIILVITLFVCLSHDDMFAASWQKVSAATVVSTVTKLDIFNDGSCKALYQFENNTLDTSNNFNASGSNITFGSGKFGSGVVFNGNGSVYSNNSNNMTILSISLWVSQTTNGSDNLVFVTGDNTETRGVRIRIANGQMEAGIYNAPSAVISSISNLTWKHIVLSYSSGMLSVYVDKVLVGTQAKSMNLDLRPFYIGGGGTTGYFYGVVDQVRIFNRALTQAEVTQLYGEGQ